MAENPNANPDEFPWVPQARGPHEMDVYELKRRRDEGSAPLVVDIREDHELEICHLDGVVHCPVSRIYGEWDSVFGGREDEEIALLCRTGTRTAQFQFVMRARGFKNVRNVVGGLMAWATAIDPEMQQY